MKKIVLLASVVLFTVATIGTISSGGNLAVNEALAGGTCCPTDEGNCDPPGCSDPSCVIENNFWRSDGKRCSAAVEEHLMESIQ